MRKRKPTRPCWWCVRMRYPWRPYPAVYRLKWDIDHQGTWFSDLGRVAPARRESVDTCETHARDFSPGLRAYRFRRV